MFKHLYLTLFLFVITGNHGISKDKVEIKVEPPFWWENMNYNQLELLVYGENISGCTIELNNQDVLVIDVFRPDNSNFLFVTVKIEPSVKEGFSLSLYKKKKEYANYYFELKTRVKGSAHREGLTNADAIYLLMPDRFANGNPDNDKHPDMLEIPKRELPLGRHGGDIKGIINNLDYIRDLGFTALWTNPLLENNMVSQSYHGYAITDLYKTDIRFGTNEDYLNLAAECEQRGIKMVMDMVFNHLGTNHWLLKDLPDSNWVHHWDSFTRSNFRGEVNIDPYRSDFDLKKMGEGWFDVTMADLNQNNPHVMQYLTQNSIWWIEYLGLSAIRMDTYQYPDKLAMALWAKTILTEYPNFTIIGEVWLQNQSFVSYWQGNKSNHDGYNSNIPSLFDFPGYYALSNAFTEEEGWTEGIMRLYYNLSQDFLYPNPENLVVFADNHDLNRYFTSMKHNLDFYKQGLVYLFTTRGIPQIYYGTEILMDGEEHISHGEIRKDYPGGWIGDSINAFTDKGLSNEQFEAREFLTHLLNWRAQKEVIHAGELKHFIPEDKTYVYFRSSDSETIMVVLNKNNEEYKLNTLRFKECLKGFTEGYDILSKRNISDLNKIILQPKKAMVIELKK